MQSEIDTPSSTSTSSATKYVVKRDGKTQDLEMNKLRKRFENLSDGLNMEYVNFDILVAKLASGIYQGKYINWYTLLFIQVSRQTTWTAWLLRPAPT